MICPECGAENKRWALQCARCKASLPHGVNRWLMAGGLGLCLAAGLIVLVRTGVLPWPTRRESPRNATRDATNPPAGENQRFPEGFSLDPPGPPWQIEDPAQSDLAQAGVKATLSLVRATEPAYGLVLSEPTPLSPAGLAALALDRLAGRTEAFELKRRRTLALDGQPAEEAEFTLRSGAFTIHYLATYGVHQGRGYQLLFWCLERHFPALRHEFEEIREGWHWSETARVPSELEGSPP